MREIFRETQEFSEKLKSFQIDFQRSSEKYFHQGDFQFEIVYFLYSHSAHTTLIFDKFQLASQKFVR